MTKKEELYCLLKLYKEGKYDIETFCDELTCILYYESNGISELNDKEKEIFKSLANVAKRYSSEEEYKMNPDIFSSEKEVYEAIELACKKLLEYK